MSRNQVAIVLFVMFTHVGSAQQYGPKDPPQRIVLNLTAKPATSIAITWRTLGWYPDAKVEIAAASDWTDFSKNARRVMATAEKIVYRKNVPSVHYSAVVTDLDPDALGSPAEPSSSRRSPMPRNATTIAMPKNTSAAAANTIIQKSEPSVMTPPHMRAFSAERNAESEANQPPYPGPRAQS